MKMEFKEAMRIWGRMCKERDGCERCPMQGACVQDAAVNLINVSAAESTLAEWAAEHPERTIADDFLEKHPKAPKGDNETPMVCANRCGYGMPEWCGGSALSGACLRCWRRPLEEE